MLRASFLGNALGSTEALTDASGTVTTTGEYDVFGALRSVQGNGYTEYLFTGQQQDNTLGYTYLRARYYDQATGRFLSKDPAGGKLRSPITQNKYVYAGNNPVNAGDPTGLVTNAQMDSWMANVPVTYWTPSGGYTSSFSSYSTSFNASRSAPTPVSGSCGSSQAPTSSPASPQTRMKLSMAEPPTATCDWVRIVRGVGEWSLGSVAAAVGWSATYEASRYAELGIRPAVYVYGGIALLSYGFGAIAALVGMGDVTIGMWECIVAAKEKIVA